QQLILAHDACAVADEMEEQIEDLRLDRYEGTVTTKLTHFRIERTSLEQPAHGSASATAILPQTKAERNPEPRVMNPSRRGALCVRMLPDRKCRRTPSLQF